MIVIVPSVKARKDLSRSYIRRAGEHPCSTVLDNEGNSSTQLMQELTDQKIHYKDIYFSSTWRTSEYHVGTIGGQGAMYRLLALYFLNAQNYAPPSKHCLFSEIFDEPNSAHQYWPFKRKNAYSDANTFYQENIKIAREDNWLLISIMLHEFWQDASLSANWTM